VVNELIHGFLHEEKGEACDNKNEVASHGEELFCAVLINKELRREN
jgi:hypothetical protein